MAAVKKAASASTTITLPPLNLQTMEVVIVGDTPLICHAWAEKARKSMYNKQTKTAVMAKEAKSPEEDFEGSIYNLEGGGYGFPSVAVKSAAVDACTSIGGVTKVAARQAFRVVGEPVLIRGAHPGLVMRADLVRILGSDPQMREDMVRVGMGTADLRYRAQFWPWHMKFHVGFNGNVLSAEQVLNLFNVAGFGVGIGDWRTEKNGTYGAFHVALEGEEEQNVKAIKGGKKAA